MKHCSDCGEKTIHTIPEGEDRLRHVCRACNTVHYQNPNVVVGTLLTQGSQVLLCQRAIEPRYGYWTLPAGFLENGESMMEGARRETYEEAGANPTSLSLYHLFSVPHISQVHAFYHSEYHGDVSAGIESLEVRWFDVEMLPWDELAFPTVYRCLKRWQENPEDLSVKEDTLERTTRS
jgi:ADP-ribose pyrophosphatase YjhB (NUDIX family)